VFACVFLLSHQLHQMDWELSSWCDERKGGIGGYIGGWGMSCGGGNEEARSEVG
jgi:hypothetical protein